SLALHAALDREILPALAQRGVRLARPEELEADGRAWLDRLFREQIAPALTPLAIVEDRPFPLLAGLTLNLAVQLEPKGAGAATRLAVVRLPVQVPRLVRVAGEGPGRFVLLEEIVRSGLAALFPGQRLLASAVFRITRDSELDLEERPAEFIET